MGDVAVRRLAGAVEELRDLHAQAAASVLDDERRLVGYWCFGDCGAADRSGLRRPDDCPDREARARAVARRCGRGVPRRAGNVWPTDLRGTSAG